jgi:hypothetical protein
LVRRAGRSGVRRKKGEDRDARHRAAGRQRRRLPRRSTATLSRGPEGAKTYPGQALVGTKDGPGRAKQEVDPGRRGKGYLFGAFQPATGEAFPRPYPARSTASWVAFLEEVELWLPAETERVYAVLDNLSSHRAPDVLLFMLAHPRREMVSQPKHAAYLNLIEPWWKILSSVALKGRRFEGWGEIEAAVARATAYWNAHRHPFVWGRRRRHQPRRRPGIALLPKAA